MVELRAVPDLPHRVAEQSPSPVLSDSFAASPSFGGSSSWVIEGELFPGSPEWQERALCAQTDPEAFFPEKGGSTREAKKICLSCDVRDRCLEYALAHDERFGIWGGLSERERRKLKRQVV
jgi:WhiB family redox-sensing transcriptional regulator